MSPVSRGRKRKQKAKKQPQQPLLLDLPGVADECSCPSCAGDLDADELIDQLCADAGSLTANADPLDAELFGATFVAMVDPTSPEIEDAMIEGIIAAFVARGTVEALVALLAIASVAWDRVGKAALAAADEVTAAGVVPPEWAKEFRQPVAIGDAWRISDSAGTGSVLIGTFHRGDRSHAFVMTVDDLSCGAASEIFLVDTDDLPDALTAIRADIAVDGFDLVEEKVEPADFRWQCERALDARAVHDEDEDPFDGPEDADADAEYGVMSLLLRNRLSTLPISDRPKTTHPEHEAVGLAALEAVAELFRAAASPLATSSPSKTRGRQAKKLRPRRKRVAGQAPVFQIKVGLRGVEPPIWRRLEVPADMSLAHLNHVIQLAFGWDNSHLHMFDTPYGGFGMAEDEGDESSVALEQVVARVGSKIRYVYDFGDDWDHEIVLEKVVDREEAVDYPRCTGGRRAAPPEDCGGMWGYLNLVDALADPGHPEHEDRMDWMGLDDPAQFDPAAFEVEAVNRALARLR